jgi:serine/threonine protein kinase
VPTRHDDSAALIGAVLNQRWRLVGLRGEGGVGVVYEVEDLRGHGRRAAKLLRAEFCDEPQIVERFLQEAQTSARINHPGVARVHEAARAEDGTPYLVMDLLTGRPLSAVMNQGRLSVEAAVPILHGLLAALAAAHEAGVVHRDLKPDNVFLSHDAAGRPQVTVLDFGVARVMDVAGGMARKTRTGMLLGTPGYMSPEQIKDVKHADLRADLWGAGVIFYELLTGVLAFDADNDFARITRVLTSEATPIEQVAPQYAHWTPFFRRALAPDPAERFQSALEMDQALLAVARQGRLPAAGELAAASAAVQSALAPPAGPFGGSGTAVSATHPLSAALARQPGSPVVQVLQAPKRGLSGCVVVLLVLTALLIGFALGLWIGITLGQSVPGDLGVLP